MHGMYSAGGTIQRKAAITALACSLSLPGVPSTTAGTPRPKSVKWLFGMDANLDLRLIILTSNFPSIARCSSEAQFTQVCFGRKFAMCMLPVGTIIIIMLAVIPAPHCMVWTCSRGKYRALGRKIDYWAIAVASAALVRASFHKTPKVVTATSLLLTPFQPFAVVAANGALVEVPSLL